MAIKTITVTEDAYDAIKRLKNEDESFSELFKRLGSKPATIKDIVGKLKTTPEDYEKFAARVRKIRQELGEGFEKRAKDVHLRFKHNY